MNGMIFGQGGFNPEGKTAQISNATTTSTTYVNALTVNGSGILIGVFPIVTFEVNGAIQIIIDGVTKFDGAVAYGYRSSNNMSLTCLFKFKNSLVINHKTSANNIVTACSYLLD